MRLIQPSTQKESIRDSDRHTQAYMQDAYYRHAIKPLDFTGDGTSVQIDGLPVRKLLFTADDVDRASLFKSQYWWNGEVVWTFRWATSGTSTNVVNVGVNLFGYDLDDDTANKTTLLSTTFNLTPSGTANYLQSKTVTSTTNVNGDMDLIGITIVRNGSADSNPDNFYFGPSYMEYAPENVQ